MLRPVAILLVLATGGGTSAQTADVIREISELRLPARPLQVNPFGGVMQQRQPPPVPPPPGVVPAELDGKPARREARRVRIPGPTPGGPVKFDTHGDPLPPGAIARFGTARLRHGGEPIALTFSPDGKWLASLSATEDGIRLWDTATGKEVARFTLPVTAAAFARDGRLVIADGSACRVWQPATNAVRELPDGTIPEHTTVLAAHPDGIAFVAASVQKVVLLDLQTGKPRREFKLPGGAPPTRAAFSPDGRWLAACGQRTGVWLWDTKTGKRARTYPHTEGDDCEFAFSPDGTRIAVATNRVRVYPTDAEEEVEGYASPDDEHARPVFSADGKSVLVALPDGNVKRFDAATGELKGEWPAPAGENRRPPVALAPDGALVAAVDVTNGIRIWDPKTGNGPAVERLTMLYDPGFTADGKAVACLDSISRLHQFDPLTGKPGEVIRLPIGEDTPVSFDPRARRAAAVSTNEDSDVQLIDVDTGKVTLKFLPPANTGMPTVAFCPTDRNRLAVFSPGTVAVVSAVTGRTARTLDVGMQQHPQKGAFSPDGRLIAVTTPALSVWEVSTGKRRFEVDLTNPNDAVFSPDGKLLAAWDNSDTVVIFDLRTGTTVRRFQLPNSDGSLSCAAFSPDGRRLATGDQSGVVALWDVATGEAVLVLDRHEGQVTGFCFHPDGTRLLSTSQDGTALYWDLSARPRPKEAAGVGGFDDALKLLGSPDAAHAQRGMEFLFRRPADAVKLLAEKLPVPKPVPADRVARLVADLDSDDFLTRTAAAKDLEAVGGEAGAALRAAAEKSPSAEVRRSAGELAAKADAPATRPDDLRVLRAVEVLEHVGTPAARDVLKAWAGGPAGHRLTVEAAAAVGRMK